MTQKIIRARHKGVQALAILLSLAVPMSSLEKEDIERIVQRK